MQKLKSSKREQIITILGKVNLFENLTTTELEYLYSLNNDFYHTQANEVFVREGAEEPFFYVLLAGNVVIYKNNRPEHEICELSPGNFVGENSYFNQRARNANVRAKGDCILMRINANTIKSLPLEVKDKIKDKIIFELVQRVSRMNKSHLDLVGEVRKTKQKNYDLDSQIQQILQEYPHIRMRYN